MSRSNRTRVIQTRSSGRSASTRIGDFGEMWYDPSTGALRVSDGETPGGVVVNSGGAANTGSITFEGVSIIGGGDGSGDGFGNGTIELVPDEGFYENGQYLVVDPTVPNHIHIRAGGTQDNSSADLFLGAEMNHVRVRDNTGVRLEHLRNLESNYYYDVGFSDAEWYTAEGNHFVDFTTTDSNIINYLFSIGNNAANRLRVYYDNGQSSYTLAQNGAASDMGGNLYRIQVNAAPPTSPTSIGALEFIINTLQENTVLLENSDFRVDVQDDIRMFGHDVFRLINYSDEEPIEITTNYNNNSWTWRFQPNGNLEFPDGTNQPTAYNPIVLQTAYTQTTDPLIPIDITKPVVKIDPIGNYDGYSLADGVEGQILHIVPNAGSSSENIGIRIANVRWSNGAGNISENQNWDWLPFRGSATGSACVTLIFTNGYWNVPHGIFD